MRKSKQKLPRCHDVRMSAEKTHELEYSPFYNVSFLFEYVKYISAQKFGTAVFPLKTLKQGNKESCVSLALLCKMFAFIEMTKTIAVFQLVLTFFKVFFLRVLSYDPVLRYVHILSH